MHYAYKSYSIILTKGTFRSYSSGVDFKDSLRQIVESTEGAVASLLMGFDGIAIDTYTLDQASKTKDITEIGMEFSVILSSIQRAVETLEVGHTREIAIQSEHMTTLIRVLSKDYFLALTVRPDGNYGKGRFMMRIAAPSLAQELS